MIIARKARAVFHALHHRYLYPESYATDEGRALACPSFLGEGVEGGSSMALPDKQGHRFLHSLYLDEYSIDRQKATENIGTSSRMLPLTMKIKWLP
ncbi:hypothetical protein [Insolitispirillum peregrinum]|uniref:hypothetical protein n=1 Tax=Insolitispirillum peregrinum TaxID=80876 RepID=UPI0011156078|nr:hypothetical protein [Insolitispirillum peregrinum]